MRVIKKIKKMLKQISPGQIYATASGVIAATFGCSTPAFAAQGETLTQVVKLLSSGVCCIGGALVIWGLVQLGMGWKDGSGGGGQINGALGFIIGGGAVFGAGLLLANLDTSWIQG